MENWQKFSGSNEELVLSSRIRLARNIKGNSFPHKLSEEDGRKLVEKVEKAFYTSDNTKEYYRTIPLWETESFVSMNYFEKHLISPKLINNSKKAAFICDNNETVSVMINEEDHLRIQCITGGLNLKEAFDTAGKIDNLIEESIDYCFDEKLGYITACPTNIGTAMRASVMIHLPALTMNNEMESIIKALTQIGMTFRGLYGEGSKALGNMYQISNQVTLGVSEEDILNNLQAVISQVTQQELKTRERLLKTYSYELEDKVFRSIGILENAILLSVNEAMSLLSNVRMGLEMGIIKDVEKNNLNKLFVDIQPGALQQRFKVVMNEKERDVNRARLVKEKLRSK